LGENLFNKDFFERFHIEKVDKDVM